MFLKFPIFSYCLQYMPV